MVNTTPQLITHRYRLLDLIGTGGMGMVYRAFDRLDKQEVALKRITTLSQPLSDQDATLSSTPARLALANEFKILAALRHPYIISVLDFGFDEQKQPFFTMELLKDAH